MFILPLPMLSIASGFLNEDGGKRIISRTELATVEVLYVCVSHIVGGTSRDVILRGKVLASLLAAFTAGSKEIEIEDAEFSIIKQAVSEKIGSLFNTSVELASYVEQIEYTQPTAK